MKNNEPRLEDIEDYDTLKGEKKKIVTAVVVIGLIIGAVYMITYSQNENVDDAIGVEKSFEKIPMK